MAKKTDSIIPEQVQRNIARFPSDFMFQLNNDESKVLRSQIATSKSYGFAITECDTFS